MMSPMPPPPGDPAAAPPPLRVPVRFQCPLCFDVLRRPILLPCCRRHLCTECFERALELTSVNCGFCRRRVVGFARTKRHKVDEPLWRAIKTQCAFLEAEADGTQDAAPAVEFVDEDAPPLHSQGEDHPTAPGEIKAFYEQQLRAHQTRRREAEQRALRQTMAFLEADAEFQAARDEPVAPAAVFRPTPTTSNRPAAAPPRRRGGRLGPSHRSLTRSKSQVDAKQQRLDLFLAPSTVVTRSMTPDPASDGDAGDPADDEEQPLKHRRRAEGAETATAATSPLRTRSQTQTLEDKTMLITRHNHYPRSASHSPQRLAPHSSKPLFQTTLVTRRHGGGGDNEHGRPSRRDKLADGAPAQLVVSTTPDKNAGKKMLTRQGSRRAWKCPRCTFKNTCFDSRCSMCHSVPPASAYTAL